MTTSLRKPRMFWALLLTTATAALAACEEGPRSEAGLTNEIAPGGEVASADDEVNLDTMLTVVGKADITHGTGPYQAPAGSVSDEREGRIFVAFLSGGQEVPAVPTRAEGAMALMLGKKRSRLRFLLQHNVEQATVAHLHIGSAGENGPVAVPLANANRSSVGTLPVTDEQASAIAAGRVYVNVHSKTNAKGEIRGQILRPGETVFVATLSGAEEVPAVSTSATGTASLILSASRDQVRYRVAFTGLAPTAAHLHRGIAGSNGPVAQALAAAAGSKESATIEGAFPVSPTDLQDLAMRSFYVNLHSSAFAAGEIRGQVLRPGEAVFAAALTGAQEVPAVTSTATGNGMVVLGSAGAKFLYVVISNAPATLGHIHKAPAGSNGPVEVPLAPVGPSMSGILDLGDARRADIEAGLWYINLHTAANPSGELRGQLLRPGAAVAAVSSPAPVAPTAEAGHAH